MMLRPLPTLLLLPLLLLPRPSAHGEDAAGPAEAAESGKAETAETAETAENAENAESNEAPGDARAGEEAEEAPLQPPSDEPRRLQEVIDTLGHDSLQRAFRLLTEDYIQHEGIDALEINRAALQGLLARLDFGAMLLTEQSRSASDSPFEFHSAPLGEEIGYVRFGRYSESELELLDEALRGFSESEAVQTLIVDLRSPQAQADFSVAAKALSRFTPPHELLFKIRRPGSERPTLFLSEPVPVGWRRDLILLVDRDTGNVGEIIAAVLKREANCLVIGEGTPGLTVEYRDVPIAEDRILRYAIAEVVLEDDSSLFQKGVEPDIVTRTDKEVKNAVFRASQGGEDLAGFVFHRQRPRMNEAALVAGIDPELDYFLLLSREEENPWDTPPPQDRVLQQAVDLLETAGFLGQAGRPARGR